MRRLLVDHVVTPGGVLHDATISIGAGRILACAQALPPDADVEQVSGWVVPGFVDTHVHGGGGHTYATEDPNSALTARAFHAARGTTTSLASLVTAPVEVLLRQLATLAELCDDGHFAGIHLEGPFLSPAQAGAHDPRLLRALDVSVLQQLIKAARGHLTMITIAPELPGGPDVIRWLTDSGILVAIGHTDADRKATAAGLDAGARSATHLFNAMRALHHRDPGPIPLLLYDRRVAVELVADGHHVHPDVLAMAAAAAGPERVVLVTDAMVAAGMADGDFRLGDREVRVVGGVARLATDGMPGPLAGSTASMAAVFEIMTSVVGGVAPVAAMASTNPARHLGLSDAGRIQPGAWADLCVVDDRGALQRVMRRGTWGRVGAG